MVAFLYKGQFVCLSLRTMGYVVANCRTPHKTNLDDTTDT